MGLAFRFAVGLLAAALAFRHVTPGGGERPVYDPSQYGFTGPGGCILPSTPPHLFGMAIPASSPQAAQDLATRLGFAGHWESNVYVCPLFSSGALLWVAGVRRPSDLRVPAGILVPLVPRPYEPPDAALPLGLWSRLPAPGSQPASNGAVALRAVIALVPSADSVARLWPPRSSEGQEVPLLPFGPPCAVEAFGARSRSAPAGGFTGRVILLEPETQDGIAASWLAGGGPRWIGLELATADLAATQRWLEGHGFHPERFSDAPDSIWIGPEQTGGTLILFRGPDQG